jgi:hypothetical protein
LVFRRHNVIVKAKLVVTAGLNHGVNPQPWSQVEYVIIGIMALLVPKRHDIQTGIQRIGKNILELKKNKQALRLSSHLVHES